jgi:antitoxin (DNA-binding transcriptional repressor) of toxin-antitoxin stability system
VKTVSARSARASISALLDAAEAGETTLIIRNSAPVAVIGPVPDARPPTYDPEEIRWYRLLGGTRRVGLGGAANAAFMALSRDDRARFLEACAAIAVDGPIVVDAF